MDKIAMLYVEGRLDKGDLSPKVREVIREQLWEKIFQLHQDASKKLGSQKWDSYHRVIGLLTSKCCEL